MKLLFVIFFNNTLIFIHSQITVLQKNFKIKNNKHMPKEMFS